MFKELFEEEFKIGDIIIDKKSKREEKIIDISTGTDSKSYKLEIISTKKKGMQYWLPKSIVQKSYKKK